MTRLSMSWVVLSMNMCIYSVYMYEVGSIVLLPVIVPRVVELYSTTVLWLMHDHCLEHLHL